uniref:Uncharacterized protein n=1 Tax=Rhizophora mucronata TaxID=61149 RepID=A0A2P2N1T1_RHIMU
MWIPLALALGTLTWGKLTSTKGSQTSFCNFILHSFDGKKFKVLDL